MFKKKHRNGKPNLSARQARIDKIDTKPESSHPTPRRGRKRPIWQWLLHFPFVPLNFVLKKIGSKYRVAFKELGLALILFAILTTPGFNYQTQHSEDTSLRSVNIDQEFFSIDGSFLQKSDIFEQVIRTDEIIEYIVKDGDTLVSLARTHGITPSTILWANTIADPDSLVVGAKLRLLPVTGIVYKVRRGDSVDSIARSYGIKSDYIVYQNKLDDAHTLLVGEEIVLPDAKPKSKPRSVTAYEVNPGIASKDGTGRMVYPTSGIVTQFFHYGHYGIDIANPKLPPIYAADQGRVVRVRYSGWNGGYGNYLVVEHEGGIQTLYAHLHKIYVKKGDLVDRGQAIGQMGNTGRSTGTHLHFELIDNGRKKNPLKYF